MSHEVVETSTQDALWKMNISTSIGPKVGE